MPVPALLKRKWELGPVSIGAVFVNVSDEGLSVLASEPIQVLLQKPRGAIYPQAKGIVGAFTPKLEGSHQGCHHTKVVGALLLLVLWGLVLLLAIVYAGGIIGLGWWRVLWRSGDTGGPYPPLAVLIPARNEAATLRQTVEALVVQRRWIAEIWILDDHSTDETPCIAEALRAAYPDLIHYLRIEQSGKKAALLAGLAQAQAEVILTVDADTSVAPNALETVAQAFTKEGVQIAMGYVCFWDERLYAKARWPRRLLLAMQALEMAGILQLTAVSWELGFPLTANGAFLAYRRSAFEAVRGWGAGWGHPSGDDDLLVQRIRLQYGSKALAFLPVVVWTRPADTWRAWFHQRLRWLSKRSLYPTPWPKVGLAILALAQLGTLVGLVSGQPLGWASASIILLAQATLAGLSAQKVGLPKYLLGWLPAVAVAYPLVIVFLAGASLLGVPFVWKGRTYHPAKSRNFA